MYDRTIYTVPVKAAKIDFVKLNNIFYERYALFLTTNSTNFYEIDSGGIQSHSPIAKDFWGSTKQQL